MDTNTHANPGSKAVNNGHVTSTHLNTGHKKVRFSDESGIRVSGNRVSGNRVSGNRMVTVNVFFHRFFDYDNETCRTFLTDLIKMPQNSLDNYKDVKELLFELAMKINKLDASALE